MHLHTRARPDALPAPLRLARRLGIEVVTLHGYRLDWPGLLLTAEWCPVCRRGQLWGEGQRQAISSLVPVLGREAPLQPGEECGFRERFR